MYDTGTGGATTSRDTQPNTPRPPLGCPLGTHFERTLKHRGGACVYDTGNGSTQGTQPGKNKCTRGTIGCRSEPNPTPKCTGGRIGTPPNCSCPPGTHWTRSEQCVEDAKPTPKPAPTPAPTAKCTGGRVGTPPNCFCRPPSRFIGRRCRVIAKPAPTPAPSAKCPAGHIGTPPNCFCPSGMTGPKCDQIKVH